MGHENYHEPVKELSAETRKMHQAIISLVEELEAVDWYNQRVDVCTDEELKSILEHNRDEEKEHAAMLLEWMRRQDSSFEKELKDYLFTDKSLKHD
jgi:ferritin-like protein